jgi:hypothetical protein
VGGASFGRTHMPHSSPLGARDDVTFRQHKNKNTNMENESAETERAQQTRHGTRAKAAEEKQTRETAQWRSTDRRGRRRRCHVTPRCRCSSVLICFQFSST